MRDKPSEWRSGTRSISRRHRTALLALLLVIGVVIGVCWLAVGDHRKKMDRGNQPSKKNELGQLVFELRESNSSKSTNSAINLDRIRRKIELAEKILEFEPGEQDRQFAITEKLSAMIARERVNFELGVSKVENSTELAGFSAGFRESVDNHVLKLAALGEAVAAISRLVQNESSSGQEQGLLQTAEDRIKAAASLAADELDIAQILHEWTQIVRQSLGDDVGLEIASAFARGFSKTNVKDVHELIAELESDGSSAADGLIDFLGVLPAQREQAIGQFAQQAFEMLSSSELEQQVFLGIVRRASELLALGRTATAESIHDQASAHKLASQELIRDQLKILNTRLELFDQPMAISEFRDFEGNPVEFGIPDAKMRLLLFVSSSSKSQSLAKLAELNRSLRPRMKDQSLEVVVIYLDDGLHPGDRSDIGKAASSNGHWKAWRLETQTEGGRQFLQNAALGPAPWLIIMDGNSQIISLGTAGEVAEEIVSKRL